MTRSLFYQPKRFASAPNRAAACVVLVFALIVVGCGAEQTASDSPAVSSEPMEASSPSPEVPATPTDSDDQGESVDILFLGDSITAGFGLVQDPAFPAIVETRLTAMGYNVTGIDAGVSGDTSTGGLNRMDWLLQREVDILVLELGGNDGLRGIDLSLTEDNLGAIIDRTREAWPEARIVVVGMQVPPNLGQEYTENFAAMYPRVAADHNAALIPFVGDDFADIVDLLQSDGIHPTAEGHRVIADKVTTALEPLVQALQDA